MTKKKKTQLTNWKEIEDAIEENAKKYLEEKEKRRKERVEFT